MTLAQLLAFVQEGGMYCAPLLLAACLWLDRDRRRLLASLSKKDALIARKDAKIESLADRLSALTSEVKGFLFTHGNGA